MKKKIISSACLVLFLNLFLFQINGLVTIILIAIASGIFINTIFGTQPKSVFGAMWGSVILSSGIMLFSAGYVPRLAAFGWIWGTLIVSAYLLGNKKSDIEDEFELGIVPWILGISWFGGVISTAKYIFSTNKPGVKLPVVRGLILGLPIAGIMAALLASGDPVYGYYWGKVFSMQFWERPLVHLIFSLVTAGIIIPTAMIKVLQAPVFFKFKRPILVTETKIIMTMVAIVLGSFLIIQGNYVFVNVAKETNLAKFGVATYSEYVKRGFGEFLLVSLIVYAIVRMGRNNKFFTTVLTGEYLIFFVSLLRRIYLYQDYHGWTLARIYGGISLIWLAGMIVLVKRFKIQAGWTSAIVAIVCLFNAENFLIQNRPPTVNNQIDYVYLSRLSPAGYEGWRKAADYSEGVLNKEYKTDLITEEESREIGNAGMIVRTLENRYNQLEQNYSSVRKWGNYLVWNYAEYRTWEKMKKEISWGKLRILSDKYNNLQQRIIK